MRRATSGMRYQIGRLPAEVTSFVDRRRELAEVKRLLSTSRLLTLTGVGGTGKTRLAIRAVETLKRAFRDGVWWVDLSGLREELLLDHEVAQVLGLRAPSDLPLAQLLADYVAGREMLLVLDNCEHQLDACASLSGRLLRAGASLRLLCTSRQPMGIVGETVMTVPPLPVPAPGASTAGGDLGQDALTLFVERAAAVAPEFTLTPHNQRTVMRICQRLDGLPLAIELAAAQLHKLSVEQVASGLRDRFQLLSARHAQPKHQRTLRDTFDWSFSLCSADEQALWARVSVFDGGFDLDGGTAVCADEDLPAAAVPELVAGLVDKSVVIRDGTAGRTSYRLLNTVREYGLERQRAIPGLTDRLCRRHRDWYLQFAERFDAEWFGPDQEHWAVRLRAEHDNLRSALGWSLTAPGESEAGLRLVGALRSYWTSCALSEGRFWLARALAADEALTATRVRALSAYCGVLVRQSDHEATAVAQESLALARQLNDPLLTVRATKDLGVNIMMSGGSLAQARSLLEEALAQAGEYRDTDEEGLVVGWLALAITLLYQGERDRAEALSEEVLALCVARGEHYWRGNALIVRALVALARPDAAGASRYLRESLRSKWLLGDGFGIAQSIELLGRAAAIAGESERAAHFTGAAHRAWREFGRHGFGSRHYREREREAAAQARGDLGDEAYEAAYREGYGMSVDDAVAYALGADQASPVPPPAWRDTPPAAPVLTPRQLQVAELIAAGLSNRQIANRLVISERTAESHTENILRRLGFTSRAQIVSWIARDKPS